MQKDKHNEERLSEAPLNTSASPQRFTQKTTTFFGLLAKRSIKVEPQPVDEHAQEQQKQQCEAQQQRLFDDRERHMNFAHASAKSQTLPTLNSSTQHTSNNNNNVNSINGKLTSTGSSTHGLLRLHRKEKSKSKIAGQRHSVAEAGSLSDGSEVIMRKSAGSAGKHRSPNHNRFSHQFSLCCKAEKKPITPPVTVRYNSLAAENSLRRDNVSLNCSLVMDNASLSLNSSDVNLIAASIDVRQQPQLLAAPSIVGQQECFSAPDSPVATKSLCGDPVRCLNSSPSNASVRSGLTATAPTTGSGPIRPLAVSACRSRLRLKLYPPGKEPQSLDSTCLKQVPPALEHIKRATTPQHMSSPNICT